MMYSKKETGISIPDIKFDQKRVPNRYVGFSSNKNDCSHVPTKTAGRLYIGGLKDAFDLKSLKQMKIVAVVNAIAPFGDWPQRQTLLYSISKIELYTIPLNPSAQKLCFHAFPLHSINSFLTRGQNVLIHSENGISRSVAVAMAYLLCYENSTVRGALFTIKQSRREANPHPSYIEQLKELETFLKYNYVL